MLGVKNSIVSSKGVSEHLIWLNDYKTFGEDSYVFQNKDILHELYEDYALCANDYSIFHESIEFAENNGTVGQLVSSIYGIENAESLKQLGTIAEIVNNDAFKEQMSNSDIMKRMWLPIVISLSGLSLSDYTRIDKVVASDSALTTITSSAAALNIIAKVGYLWSEIKPLIFAINDSEDLCQNVGLSLTDTQYFTAKAVDQCSYVTQGSADFEKLGSKSYAQNGILVYAIGHLNDNIGGGSVTVNGDIVKSISSSGLRNPSTVRGKENAVAVPPASFSKINSSYNAMSVYIAN